MSATRKRCAIYTRKSTEEGLDQDFNSLYSQAESCDAYIHSQAGEGWTATGKVYSDGGISGGHMDRPGLLAMIADIEAGLIDIVVVYKVDRLTRSLADFAKLVDVFDRHNVSFVSITQAFNTFIREHAHLTSSQINFLRGIRSAVIKHTLISRQQLMKPPLSRVGNVENLFTQEEIAEVIDFANQFSRDADAA